LSGAPIPAGRRRVFPDSSAYLALANARDDWHHRARAGLAWLSRERFYAFTSNFVVAETHALFLARLGRNSAAAFLRQTVESATSIVRVRADDEERSRQIVFR
jgi:predicted nucleic acid-binding protein